MAYKEDLRIIRTRKLLSNTLIEMMEKNSLEKISVIDLCNNAMVNRATFYAHFEDKYHLLAFAFEELKDEIYSSFSGDILVSTPREMLRKLTHMALGFVKDNRNHVFNILNNNRNEKVIANIKESLVKSVKYQLGKFKETYPMRVPLTVSAIAFSGALVDLCIWYMDNSDKYTEEEMATFMDNLLDDWLK